MVVFRSSVAAALVLATSLPAGVAHAQGARPAAPPPPPGAVAPATAAASLAKEGRALIAKGQSDAGCAKLSESVKLDARSAVALELATCLEKQGKRALAFRMLDVAAASAQREKTPGTEKAARARQKALEKSVALLWVTDHAGAAVTLDGANVETDALASAIALEPGPHLLSATRGGKRVIERKLELQAGQRETLGLGSAEPGAGGAAASSDRGELPAEGAAVADASEALDGDASHLVLEIGWLGGVAYGAIGTDATSSLDGLPYAYPGTSGGDILAGCGDTTTIPGAGTCEGTFRGHTGAAVGGQAFVGWALQRRLHFGGRFVGTTMTPGGFLLGLGPSVSYRLTGPVWLGLSALVGYEQQRAVMDGARGSVPAGSQAAAGSDQVNVPLPSDLLGAKIDIDSGVVGGGMLEVAVSVFGVARPGLVPTRAPHDLLKGSMLVGLWPTVLAGARGAVVAIPVGVSYRFH